MILHAYRMLILIPGRLVNHPQMLLEFWMVQPMLKTLVCSSKIIEQLAKVTCQ